MKNRRRIRILREAIQMHRAFFQTMFLGLLATYLRLWAGILRKPAPQPEPAKPVGQPLAHSHRVNVAAIGLDHSTDAAIYAYGVWLEQAREAEARRHRPI